MDMSKRFSPEGRFNANGGFKKHKQELASLSTGGSKSKPFTKFFSNIMRTDRGVTLCTSLFLGISLIFCPILGSCHDHTSHSSKVGRYNPNSCESCLEIDTSTCCGSDKFIMESYYEKHESFDDRTFDNFLTQELPVNVCEQLTCNLNSNTKGEGSHRQHSSTIRFSIKESISRLPNHHCNIIIIERLPSGVFADPFELQHLLHRAVFSDVAVFGDTNLELPSILSNLSIVEVHIDIGLNVLSRDKNSLDFTIDLPLHARYPPLDESGYVGVRLKAPDLFLRCSVQEKTRNGSCLFKLKYDDSEPDVKWLIPAGKRLDVGVVTTVTFISALLSVLSIIMASIYSGKS